MYRTASYETEIFVNQLSYKVLISKICKTLIELLILILLEILIIIQF